MKTLIIDTNILLRFLLADVPKQFKEVKKVFEEAKTGQLKLIISQITIFEVIFNLVKLYQFKKEIIVFNLRRLLAVPYLEIQDREIFDQALVIFKDANLDFVDCFILAFGQIAGSKIFTFDRKIKRFERK